MEVVPQPRDEEESRCRTEVASPAMAQLQSHADQRASPCCQREAGNMGFYINLLIFKFGSWLLLLFPLTLQKPHKAVVLNFTCDYQ